MQKKVLIFKKAVISQKTKIIFLPVIANTVMAVMLAGHYFMSAILAGKARTDIKTRKYLCSKGLWLICNRAFPVGTRIALQIVLLVLIWLIFMTLDQINVLVGCADWAWPEAISSIFAPRGINAMVAADAARTLDIIEKRRIHTAIVDMDTEMASGLSVIRIIRNHNPFLPCILVASSAGQKLLSMALELDVFSVIEKPVDMSILQDQLNRLFIKRYNCSVFTESRMDN